MNRGVLLISIGKPAYARFAYNMAVSIKSTSPDIAIQLATDGNTNSIDTSIFDHVTNIPESICKLNGKTYPALTKLSMYDLSVFYETLYLDVDGLIIKDLNEYFNGDRKDYESMVQRFGSLNETDYGSAMVWATGKQIVDHYGLEPETKIPFVNSSWQYFKKCDTVKALFGQAKANLSNAIPARELNAGWGKKEDRRQPDELYMNVACAQLGIDPTSADKLLYFHLANVPNYKLTTDYYGFGLFGNKTTNHREAYRLYDLKMRKFMKERGGNHHFKIHTLMQDKFMSNG
jgi:hypothetical protein